MYHTFAFLESLDIVFHEYVCAEDMYPGGWTVTNPAANIYKYLGGASDSAWGGSKVRMAMLLIAIITLVSGQKSRPEFTTITIILSIHSKGGICEIFDEIISCPMCLY